VGRVCTTHEVISMMMMSTSRKMSQVPTPLPMQRTPQPSIVPDSGTILASQTRLHLSPVFSNIASHSLSSHKWPCSLSYPAFSRLQPVKPRTSAHFKGSAALFKIFTRDGRLSSWKAVNKKHVFLDPKILTPPPLLSLIPVLIPCSLCMLVLKAWGVCSCIYVTYITMYKEDRGG
jgi:hypothetical protein